MTRRAPARPHRHVWQAIAIGNDGRVLEGCAVDRCTVTRVGEGRQVGLWDDGISAPATPSGPRKSLEQAEE